ncbi:hypothetical protein KSS87_007983, partial [Heliosperma pusillum]
SQISILNLISSPSSNNLFVVHDHHIVRAPISSPSPSLSINIVSTVTICYISVFIASNIRNQDRGADYCQYCGVAVQNCRLSFFSSSFVSNNQPQAA